MPQGNPTWYKDAIIYQVHVQSFFDSDGDGIGDFRGLTGKLDYIRDLGVTAIWLLPFYPSPLKDGGYDISDYTSINPIYGTIGHFKNFLKEAHRRNLKVITELVLNHTSSQHPWFQRARKAPAGSKYRDFYVWNDSPDKYEEARIIFQDFESSNWSWDNRARAYYWHRFYSHQPDLNFDNKEVHRTLFRVLEFWFDMGVDGMRLDAIPYLYEREGTNCENLPETHAFLKKLRSHIDRSYQDKLLLAEANQWTDDAVAYFGEGDECHMNFHFPLMPRLFMALRMEDRFPVVDIFDQTPEIPENCQWAIFLRNHDELTLEMVTDEERDYMYRSYAADPKQRINLGIRRRLAPLLENDRKKIELLNILLLSFPGSPIIYYGDELGMGDNYYLGDRDGVRTPMQWSSDKNAGFSYANPQQLYLPVIIDPEYHFETINVENQASNLSSLFWWMKQMIGIRKKFRSFSRGKLSFIESDNPHVLAFTRTWGEETVMVIANLSRYPQIIRLNMPEYEGQVPQEMFSEEDFRIIENDTYDLSLGSYGYYWFNIVRQDGVSDEGITGDLAEINTSIQGWNHFDDLVVTRLESGILKNYIRNTRWFRDKALKIRTCRIADHITAGPRQKLRNHLLIVRFSYTNAGSKDYFLPLSVATGDEMYSLQNEYPGSILASIDLEGEKGLVFDALYDKVFQQQLLTLFRGKRKLKGEKGEISFHANRHFYQRLMRNSQYPGSELLPAEQSNTAILYEDVFLLKFYRSLEEGTNPEVELLRFLTERAGFKHVPLFAGSMEYSRGNGKKISTGILSDFVQHETAAWEYFLGKLDLCFQNILSQKTLPPKASRSSSGWIRFSMDNIKDEVLQLLEPFFIEMVELLGRRTAEMHSGLLTDSEDPRFKPEPFSLLYQKSIFQSLRVSLKKTNTLLRSRLRTLPDPYKELAREVLEAEPGILAGVEPIRRKKIDTVKSRIHGDYHLGQVLFTGKDFIIIDFEGEPARSLSERLLKYCPLKDAAGMVRSIHYAIFMVFQKYQDLNPENKQVLEPWLDILFGNISGLFLSSYMRHAREAGIIPEYEDELKTLLVYYLMEKAVYELAYELNNRPDWVQIPLKGILHQKENLLQEN